MDFFKRSVSRKLMFVVLATTFLSLLTYGMVMLIYDLRSYHDALIKDLTTQANIIAEVSAPALEFADPITAQENLDLLGTRPSILLAAIYDPKGVVFADYSATNERAVPLLPGMKDGYLVSGNRISVLHTIRKNDNTLGSVYIRARYEVFQRLTNYTLILGGVMLASMILAVLISGWLQTALTRPLYAVTNVAREVMQRRDFSLRAEKYTEDEIGVLVEAFNDMLSEVERRARALEDSNRSLEHEMAERHAAENALLLADRRKDEFLATLAHELRNPLAPLLNSLKILRLADQEPGIVANAQEIMERQLKQMVRLVDDLLDVSRITTGKLTITPERLEVQKVMRAAIETCGPFIESCGHELQVEMPSEPIYVDADSVRLAQVFANLLNNSAKYTNPGGHIVFSARLVRGVGPQPSDTTPVDTAAKLPIANEQGNTVGQAAVEPADAAPVELTGQGELAAQVGESVPLEHIVVEVSDDGIGLAPEMLPEIFHMFTQVDYSLERTHAGLGVGLALSKRLVELHSGTLTVISAGVGQGSAFCVNLARAPAPTVVLKQQAPQTASDGVGHRILLVDDNVDFVTSMASLLTLLGHEVRTVHDGISATRIAEEFAPEFAFLDIGMPGLNGYDLARRLRDSPVTANCVLTAVTGWGQEKDRERSRLAGFDYHLVKPVELARVLEVLETKRVLRKGK